MFNSVVIDVVIGLVLIYLLYSLLVSIVGEMISSRMQIRANMLKNTIAAMLIDDKEVKTIKTWYEKLWYKILWIKRSWNNFFSYIRPDFKYSLAEKFYNYPSIKYLGKNEFKNLPAYISKENFSDTLFNTLREKGTGGDDMAKIDFCLKYNTLNIDGETKKHIANLLDTANSNPNLFKTSLRNWFDETMDRLNGWYKRRIQFILFWFGFIMAISFNVDSINIARMLSKDKDARNLMVQMGTTLAKDSMRYERFVVSNGDTLMNQAVIDSGYAHISKDIMDANLILGLGWKFDKLRKDYKCNLDQKNDGALIRKITFINDNRITGINKDIDSLSKKIITLRQSITNIEKKKNEFEIVLAHNTYRFALTFGSKSAPSKPSIDSIKAKIELFNIPISIQTELLHAYSDSLLILKKYKSAYYQEINSLTDNNFASIDTIYYTPETYTISGKREYNFPEKVYFVFCSLFSNWSRLIGFVITALALSLGAPFWFDLLKKLVSIRSSGVKPEEKSKVGNGTSPIPSPVVVGEGGDGAKPVADPDVNLPANNTESPIEAALRIYSDTIKNIKGVVNVAQGYFKDGNKVLKCVQIHVEDQDAAIKIRSLYSQLRIGKMNLLLQMFW